MAETIYTPGVGNSPFGDKQANAQGSNYPLESGFTPTETLLLEREVKRAIFDAAPAQYMSLKVLFSKPFEEKNLTEFTYLEKTFDRSPLEANAISAAVPAVPLTVQTQAITLTAASIANVSRDMIVIYPNNDKGTVVNIVGLVITVNSHTGFGLPAVAVGDIFAIQSTIDADARDHFNPYGRLQLIERYNYIQSFIRARRWGRIELQEWKNSGKTDYLDFDKKVQTEQLRVDMFNSFWNGLRGEVQLEDLTLAKAMGGIYTLMLLAGSAQATTTIAAFEDTFKALAFNTNYKSDGSTRFVYGTHEMLDIFASVFKMPQVRYAPNDMVAKLDLSSIVVGGMTYVLVPTELWREDSCFPDDWKRRLIVLDQETVRPVKLKGLPAFEAGETDDITKGSRETFKDWWVKGMLSIEFNNPLASFIIDVQ